MNKILATFVCFGFSAAPVDILADPTTGDHAMNYYVGETHDNTEISTPPMHTNETGSTIIVGLGRGNRWDEMTPTDNMGNGLYQKFGETQPYTRWPAAGTALYACPSAVGGSNHVITVPIHLGDEVTVMAVEVTGAGQVQDFSWKEVLSGTITSDPVTTTGPATLVAFWWGDGNVGPHIVEPNNGFVVVESLLVTGWVVQGAVATKDVDTAGTYDVSWSSDPVQGAQLWLIAVQENTISPVPDVSGFSLHQNAPNPFNPSTSIRFGLPQPSFTRLRVFSADGRLTRTIFSGMKSAGDHYFSWNGRDEQNREAPSGVYFYRIEAGAFLEMKKMVLIR